MASKYPAMTIKWKPVDSTNVETVGWDRHKGMYVIFKGGTCYLYHGVSRQQVVAAANAKSVGQYLNSKIKPNFEVTRIA
jgi:hypothetical protein